MINLALTVKVKSLMAKFLMAFSQCKFPSFMILSNNFWRIEKPGLGISQSVRQGSDPASHVSSLASQASSPVSHAGQNLSPFYRTLSPTRATPMLWPVAQRHQTVSNFLALLLSIGLDLLSESRAAAPYGTKFSLEWEISYTRPSVLPSSWLDLRPGWLDLKTGWLAMTATKPVRLALKPIGLALNFS